MMRGRAAQRRGSNVKAEIHPTWYPEAQVICACGNTWTTGSTVKEIRTDVCAACHPFYTGEQRIVDTEGQVDRFYKRLQARQDIQQVQEEAKEALTSTDVPVTEMELGSRYENALDAAGVKTVGDILRVMEDGSLTDIKGIGAKTRADIVKWLRQRGYDFPEA
jgi:large subunit ribosomal protein L31